MSINLTKLISISCCALILVISGHSVIAESSSAASEEVRSQPADQSKHSVNQRNKMKSFISKKKVVRAKKRTEMLEKASKMRIPLRSYDSHRQKFSLQKFLGNRPLYYTSTNYNAAVTVGVDKVWSGGALGLNLDGTGQVIGLWDEGQVLASHQEFNGRVTNRNQSALSHHSTHVAGTLVASGVLPQARGMARNSTLKSYDWDNDESEMASEQLAANPIKVSNHSYGLISGWEYDFFNDGRWVWFGDVSKSNQEDPIFGYYGEEAQDWDEIANNSPYYLMVMSVGNDRNDYGPPPGSLHWQFNGSTSSYELSTLVIPRDGGSTGYDTINGGSANAKNVITVGAVRDIFGGYNSPADVQVTDFSNWGPTDDGRIKPDLVANGDNVSSSIAQSTGSYGYYTGTSMASPGVAGSLALLTQHAKTLFGTDLRAATLKALIIHTANESGNNPGPDYQHGWGLLNTAGSASLLSEQASRVNTSNWHEEVLNNAAVDSLELVSNGQSPLKVTLSWTDPAGVPVPLALDPVDLMLVNDLDLRIIAPNGDVVEPWVLEPATPGAAAFRGDNFRDNVEQVWVSTPIAGVYTVQVSHKNALQGGTQAYSLIVSGHTDETAGTSPPTIVSTPETNAWVGEKYRYDTNFNIEVMGTRPISYQLLEGPSGMVLSSSGVVTWTPSVHQLGEHQVEIEARNDFGVDTQTYAVTVQADPPVNFNNATLGSFGQGEDITGIVSIESGGTALRLTGNLWKQINFSYNVTPDTVLEFDFSSSIRGEIHAIGLDNDLSPSSERVFQLYGTQNWGIQSFKNYPGGGIVQHYRIPVGTYFTGVMQYMVFVMDHDQGASAEGQFSNIRVYEDVVIPAPVAPKIVSIPNTQATVSFAYTYDADNKVDTTGTAPISYSLSGPAGMVISASTGLVTWTPSAAGVFAVEITASNAAGSVKQNFSVTVSDVPPINVLNFNNYQVGSYVFGEDVTGVVTVENGGAALRVKGNLWKKINFPYTVTTKTILEFDFSSSIRGEIHAIGMDNNLTESAEKTFQLYGTQSWGVQSFKNYPGGGVTRHYKISLGDYFSGAMQYLFFIMDHDQGANGESLYSNVRIYEEGEIPPTIAPKITSFPATVATAGQAYAYDADSKVEATGTGPISFSLTGPVGMSINSSSGLVSWTPASAGTFAVAITASNAAGNAAQNFSVTVAAAPPSVVAPTITSTGATTATVGQAYAYDADSKVDATGTGPITYSLVGPTGMSINASSGLISWTPASAGSFAVAITASNVAGNATQNFSVTVAAPPPVVAPTITSTGATTAIVGQAYAYDADNKVGVTGTGPITFSLTGPTGMNISATTGLINWTPVSAGTFAVTITASNAAGNAVQQFSVVVTNTPPNTGLNFNNHVVSSYGAGEDGVGVVTKENGGYALRLTGNLWKKITLPYVLTADTVLEFDFSSSIRGEIHAIGMDSGDSPFSGRTFQLYGTQSWGVPLFKNYQGGGVAQHYRIPIGAFYTGQMQYLFFIMDHDQGATAESLFSNVRIYDDIPTPVEVAPQINSVPNTEATVGQAYVYDADSKVTATGTGPISFSLTGPAGMSINASSGLVSWTPTVSGTFSVEITATNSVGSHKQNFNLVVFDAPPSNVVNFNNYSVGSYLASEDKIGVVSIESGGAALRLTGNIWKKINYPYTITANTVLEFDFTSNIQGEIHAIGMDNNLTDSSEKTFQLYGSQSWGVQSFKNYPGGGVTRHYKIPIGAYFTGAMEYLFFVMDHDGAGNGEGLYKNIVISEQPN